MVSPLSLNLVDLLAVMAKLVFESLDLTLIRLYAYLQAVVCLLNHLTDSRDVKVRGSRLRVSPNLANKRNVLLKLRLEFAILLANLLLALALVVLMMFVAVVNLVPLTL